jgi:hypothetical protein
MTNLEKIALNLLSTEEFFLGKKTYQRTSFEEMRANVISRARETLEALEAYTDGVLNAPMAWTARNAIAIKVGYGVKNEALWNFKDQYGDSTDTLRANGRTRDEQRLRAIGFFSSAIPEFEAGSLDEAIKAKLASYHARGEAGKQKRKAKAALHQKPKLGLVG